MTGIGITAAVRRRIPKARHLVRSVCFGAGTGTVARGARGFRFAPSAIPVVATAPSAFAWPLVQDRSCGEDEDREYWSSRDEEDEYWAREEYKQQRELNDSL